MGIASTCHVGHPSRASEGLVCVAHRTIRSVVRWHGGRLLMAGSRPSSSTATTGSTRLYLGLLGDLQRVIDLDSELSRRNCSGLRCAVAIQAATASRGFLSDRESPQASRERHRGENGMRHLAAAHIRVVLDEIIGIEVLQFSCP